MLMYNFQQQSGANQQGNQMKGHQGINPISTKNYTKTGILLWYFLEFKQPQFPPE